MLLLVLDMANLICFKIQEKLFLPNITKMFSDFLMLLFVKQKISVIGNFISDYLFLNDLYFDNVIFQSPFPKGEVYIGHVDGGYGVTMGAKDVRSSMVYVFTLNTPDRDFILSADTREDMDQWINAFKEIQTTEPTSQDLRRKFIDCMILFLSLLCITEELYIVCVL